MEKGNQPAGSAGSGSEVKQASGGEEAGGGGSTAGATSLPADQGTDLERTGGGGQAAGGTEPTSERDPWAGTPSIGETTLPDGTKLRRDARGNTFRGPDADGREHVWDQERGRWLDTAELRENPGSAGWGDPAEDWQKAWGGQPMPETWKGVPRTGQTQVPEGTLNRDAAGGYGLETPSGQSYRWNEQTRQWYNSETGQQAPPGLGGDPVADWRRGADADTHLRAHPEGPRPTWRGPVQP